MDDNQNPVTPTTATDPTLPNDNVNPAPMPLPEVVAPTIVESVPTPSSVPESIPASTPASTPAPLPTYVAPTPPIVETTAVQTTVEAAPVISASVSEPVAQPLPVYVEPTVVPAPMVDIAAVAETTPVTPIPEPMPVVAAPAVVEVPVMPTLEVLPVVPASTADSTVVPPVVETPVIMQSNLPPLPVDVPKPKRKSGLRCFGLILLLLLILSVVVVAVGYFFWYLPRQAMIFNQATAASFKEIVDLTDAIAPKIENIFGSSGSSSAANKYQALSAEAADYSLKIKSAQNTLSDSTSATTELAESLRKYYTDADKFATEYANAMGVLEDSLAILLQIGDMFSGTELNTANTTEKLRTVTEAMRSKIADLKLKQTEITQVRLTNTQLKEYQEIAKKLTDEYIKTAEDILVSFDKIAVAVEAQSQLQSETAINELNAKIDSLREIRPTQTTQELVAKQEKIEEFFTSGIVQLKALQSDVESKQAALNAQLNANPLLQLGK